MMNQQQITPTAPNRRIESNAMSEADQAGVVSETAAPPSVTQPTGARHMPRGKAMTNGTDTAESNGVGGNKMEAVRRALGALGGNAKPTALHSHILREFKLDISTNMISSYKSTILKSSGSTGKKRGRKPKSETMAVTTMSNGVIDDLRTLKELVTRLGAGGVRELLDLLA
jgi:hypothetical protein